MNRRTTISLSIIAGTAVIMILIGVALSRTTTHTVAAPAPLTTRDRDAIIKMARQGLPQWLDTLYSDEEWKLYGFESIAELDRATLGEPFEVWELTPDALTQHQPGRPAVLTDLRQYQFPILVDGQARGVLEVAYFQDKWQIVGLGNRGAGEPLVALRERLKGQEANIRLVRFFPANAEFALIERDKSATMVLLGGYAGLFPQLDRNHWTEYPLDLVMAQIREAHDEIQRLQQQRPHQAP